MGAEQRKRKKRIRRVHHPFTEWGRRDIKKIRLTFKQVRSMRNSDQLIEQLVLFCCLVSDVRQYEGVDVYEFGPIAELNNTFREKMNDANLDPRSIRCVSQFSEDQYVQNRFIIEYAIELVKVSFLFCFDIQNTIRWHVHFYFEELYDILKPVIFFRKKKSCQLLEEFLNVDVIGIVKEYL